MGDLYNEFSDHGSSHINISVALRGVRGEEGLTQKELADKSGIPQSHISLMEHDKMTIGLGEKI